MRALPVRSWLALGVCLLSTARVQAAEDPFLGTWTMDIGASRYASGDYPRKMVILMQETPEGIRYRSESTQPDGRVTSAEYVADYSGHLALVVGNAGMMTPVSTRRLDSHTVEATYMRGFRPTATSRRVLSADGRVMTITTTSQTQSGETVVNVGVYVKVQS